MAPSTAADATLVAAHFHLAAVEVGGPRFALPSSRALRSCWYTGVSEGGSNTVSPSGAAAQTSEPSKRAARQCCSSAGVRRTGRILHHRSPGGVGGQQTPHLQPQLVKVNGPGEQAVGQIDIAEHQMCRVHAPC